MGNESRDELNPDDIGFILESLSYTKKRFEEYKRYPSESFRRQQIQRVEEVIRKVRLFGKSIREGV